MGVMPQQMSHLFFVFELPLQQHSSLPCTCNCTSFAWKRDRNFAIYSAPNQEIELSVTSQCKKIRPTSKQFGLRFRHCCFSDVQIFKTASYTSAQHALEAVVLKPRAAVKLSSVNRSAVTQRLGSLPYCTSFKHLSQIQKIVWDTHRVSGVQRSGDARRDFLILCPYQILVLGSGVWWSLLLDIRCLCRHIHVCKPTFWRSLMTQHAYYSTHSPYSLL